MLMNVANTKRIKTFEEDTVRLGMETGFNYISRWNLQLSSQQAKVKYEPIFVFKK